jgi:glycosyltransferase involved in cell wall biosynthesis
MKVLVFTTVFPNPAQPTQGLFVFERIRHLAEIAELRVVAPIGWRVRVATRVPARASTGGLDVAHPTFMYVPGLFKVLDGVLLFCSSVRTLAKIRREFAFELIDAHFTYPDGFAAVLLGRWFGCPVTITERGTVTQLSPYRLRRAAMSWAFRHATRVITVAQPLAQRALALGAPPARLAVIPNGVSAEAYAPRDRDEARRQLGVPLSGRLLVSVGRLIPSKGFERIIRVLPELVRDEPELRLAIVGGNPSGEKGNIAELRRVVATLGLTERVQFTGEQPPAMVATWLNAADVFVLASDMEGCPNVVWEALACGRPVVATRVGEVERMVPSFGGVLFDDPDDGEALRACVRGALNTKWDTDAIRAYAAAHTWTDVAQRVMEQWRLACDANRAAGQRQGAARLEPMLTNFQKKAE